MELGGELSEEVSSEDALLGATSSDESAESSSDDAPARTKQAEEKPEAPAEGSPKEHSAAKPGGEVKPKATSKKPARRSKEACPFILPGDPAPNHRGRPNAEGVLYPGFPKEHPLFCDACEVLRRCFNRTGKAHNPTCAWRSRG